MLPGLAPASTSTTNTLCPWAPAEKVIGVADVETLRRLMPPPAETDTPADWARLEESWGTKFPSDYQQFMALYGAGTVGDYLAILEPQARADGPGSGTDGMVRETATAEFTWAKTRKSPQLAGANPVLLAWAVDSSADILCWDGSGEDPDDWPVLVFNRDDMIWQRYECRMVDFLVRVLRSDFDECPLGGLNLWGIGSTRFLTPREEKRLLRAGLDPWTGKPDPYAGMYPV